LRQKSYGVESDVVEKLSDLKLDRDGKAFGVKKLDCDSMEAWREWLKDHHRGEKEIWLVFHKKGGGKSPLDYDATLDEALCWGWIDSLIKNIDDETYARKFTPRNEVSKWSAINKERVERLTREGRMTKAGLAVVRAAKANGCWDKPDRPPAIDTEAMPVEFEEALERNREARGHFESLVPSQRKRYIMWIALAKRPETRAKRIAEALALLEKKETLGLK
jgi:uncharacterized protein YdeI (YjbR/CyaY-like superfamily)